MLAVEAQDGGLVLGACGEAAGLVVPDGGSHRRRLGLQQLGALPYPAGDAGGAAAQDQAAQRRGAVQHVLHGQHPAPGAAEQVQVVQAERLPDHHQLLDEPFDRPQRAVVGTIRAAAAELVVEDDPAPVGEVGEPLQVVVREAGAAVQAQQRRSATATDALVPDLAAGDLDVALVRHWRLPSSLRGDCPPAAGDGAAFGAPFHMGDQVSRARRAWRHHQARSSASQARRSGSVSSVACRALSQPSCTRPPSRASRSAASS